MNIQPTGNPLTKVHQRAGEKQSISRAGVGPLGQNKKESRHEGRDHVYGRVSLGRQLSPTREKKLGSKKKNYSQRSEINNIGEGIVTDLLGKTRPRSEKPGVGKRKKQTAHKSLNEFSWGKKELHHKRSRKAYPSNEQVKETIGSKRRKTVLEIKGGLVRTIRKGGPGFYEKKVENRKLSGERAYPEIT